MSAFQNLLCPHSSGEAAKLAVPVPVRGEGKSLPLLTSAKGVGWLFLRIVLCDALFEAALQMKIIPSFSDSSLLPVLQKLKLCRVKCF